MSAGLRRIVRCPLCGSTDAGMSEERSEIRSMSCRGCGHTEVADSWQIGDAWVIDLAADERPSHVPPLAPGESGSFVLRGARGDATRTLAHSLGYEVAIPGHPRELATTGRYEMLMQLEDAPIEIGARVEAIATSLSTMNHVVSSLYAYAQSRAENPGRIQPAVLDGKRLPRGADAAMCVEYRLRGNDPDAMELLVTTAKGTPSYVHAVHVTARYHREAVSPWTWGELKQTLLEQQTWLTRR